uniref:Serpin domain-containing protein n=1 Tax=Biomphalaria glabrata TaxID=6526 RepID=A0A2C9KQ61_BIOGL
MNTSRILVLVVFLVLLAVIALTKRADAGDEQELSAAKNEISRYRRTLLSRNRGGNRDRDNRTKQGKKKGNNSKKQKLSPEERIGVANSHVALNVFTSLYPSINSNTIFSPHSLHTALAMTMLGAKKDTKKEFYISLGLKAAKVGKSEVHGIYKKLLQSLSSRPDIILSYANSVYVKSGLELKKKFRTGLTTHYHAKVDNFNMTDPEGPERSINAWVANATRGKISDILKKGDVNINTAMIIINAVYLNASWAIQFQTFNTKPKPFYSLNSGVQTIPTMHIVQFYNYANHHDTEVIELNFNGSQLAMYILLPSAKSNLNQLLQNMKASSALANPFDELLTGLERRNLNLSLPTFKIQSDVIDLVPALKNLGLKKAFNSSQADFKGIAKQKLFLDKVIQKAVISVNETGCEAAAATDVIFGLKSSRPTPALEVKVDRPFLYVIRSKAQKVVLFMGTFVGV